MGCYHAFLKTNRLTIQLLNWAGVKTKNKTKQNKKQKTKKSKKDFFLKIGPQCDQSIFNVIPEFQIH